MINLVKPLVRMAGRWNQTQEFPPNVRKTEQWLLVIQCSLQTYGDVVSDLWKQM